MKTFKSNISFEIIDHTSPECSLKVRECIDNPDWIEIVQCDPNSDDYVDFQESDKETVIVVDVDSAELLIKALKTFIETIGKDS